MSEEGRFTIDLEHVDHRATFATRPRERTRDLAHKGLTTIRHDHLAGQRTRLDAALSQALQRAAARPVGAASAIRISGSCSSNCRRMRTTVDVFPLPGPPEITQNR